MTGLHNSLAHGVSPWEQSPRRLISLLEMIQSSAIEFLGATDLLEIQEQQAHQAVVKHGTDCLADDTKKQGLLCVLSIVESATQKAKLDMTNQRIAHLKDWLHPSLQCPFQVIQSEVYAIKKSLFQELRKRKFAFILPEKDAFFECDDLFGKNFHNAASPEINSEIKAAGNCLAVELNTAAIFHSIRAAELGMRRLASRLKVVVFRDKKKYRIKIKDATWDELIKGIEEKIESEMLKPKAERKLKSHFRDYEILAGQLNRLKDDRNDVMHTHGDYRMSEAMSVFERVRDFMQRLAKRISIK